MKSTITGLFLFVALSLSAQNDMTKKLMMGYQGWFLCKGDLSPSNTWRHWFDSQTDPSASQFTIDMWPEMSEYADSYETTMKYANGSKASLFSSHDLSTTRKHFEWMKEYNIHGVFLQRFLDEVQDNAFFLTRNNTLQNVLTASTEYNRHFALMYDLTSVDDANIYNFLVADWEYLVDNYNMLIADSYLKQDNRPVIALWGIGFKDRGLNAATFTKIIDYFQKDADPKYRAYVMGGVPGGWRELIKDADPNPGWTAVYNSLDMISPWTVGRYNTIDKINTWKTDRIVPDLVRCNTDGMEYMPVIWPGFSWHNKNIGDPLDQVPRDNGKYYWQQAYNAISAGVDFIYVAMFDEVDEGTAMFKITETKADLPVEAKDIMVTLDRDGVNLPSDWYLRLADETQQMLDGSIPLSSGILISPNVLGVASDYQAEDATISGPTFGNLSEGFYGTGYLDFQNSTGDYIEWNVNVPKADNYDLEFRYSLQASSSRPLELKVNGQTVVASLDFPITHLWSNWMVVKSNQVLNSGDNTIRLTAIGSSGGNFDQLYVKPPASAPTYVLSVINGTGSGSFEAGTSVNILANAAPDGKVFDKWIISGTAAINNIYASSTTVTMTAGPSIVTAKYISGSELSYATVNKAIDIYPNPLKQDLLTIDLSGMKVLDRVEIYISNINGQVVYRNTIHNEKLLEINTDGILGNAIYVVTVKTESFITTTKLLIQ